MADTTKSSDESFRQMFKFFNRFMLLIFRLGLGRYGNGPQTSQIMVLVHRGRKSGLTYRTPINYAMVDGEIYCTAAFGHRADWYRNIMANPEVEMWLKDSWWSGIASEVPEEDPRRNNLMREVLIASGFAAPLFAGIDPKTITEATLAEISSEYRLIHVRRSEARTGSGGPGDLAWVWPLATTILLALLLLRPALRNCGNDDRKGS